MRFGGPDARAYAKALSWVFAVVSALLWASGAAAATPPPPEDVPAVSAYVELVPTSRGSRAARAGGTESRTLTSRIEAKLTREGGSDAAALKKVATSPAYGAPRIRKPVRPEAEPTEKSATGAAVSVVTDGGDDRLLALGFVLVAVTGGAAAAAYLRRPTR
jgi:hypothetical protein